MGLNPKEVQNLRVIQSGYRTFQRLKIDLLNESIIHEQKNWSLQHRKILQYRIQSESILQSSDPFTINFNSPFWNSVTYQ